MQTKAINIKSGGSVILTTDASLLDGREHNEIPGINFPEEMEQ